MKTTDFSRLMVMLDCQHSNVSILAYAAKFYVLNHLIAENSEGHVIATPQGAQYERLRQELYVFLVPRMVTYLWLIINREYRHASASSVKNPSVYPNPVGAEWCMDHLVDKSSDSILGFLKNPGMVGAITEAVDIVDSIEEGFRKGYWGASFGGKKWAEIARVLSRWLNSEISDTVMLDTCMTICHNCGPIFNKGYIFKNPGKKILSMLDIQHDGKMVEYLMHVKTLGGFDFVSWLSKVDPQIVARGQNWKADSGQSSKTKLLPKALDEEATLGDIDLPLIGKATPKVRIKYKGKTKLIGGKQNG